MRACFRGTGGDGVERIVPAGRRGASDGLEPRFRAAGRNFEKVPAIKLDRITSNPACMNGQPRMRNLRLTVRRVVQLAALYPDRTELQKEFPELEPEDVRQALVFAAASLDDRVLELAGPHETAA